MTAEQQLVDATLRAWRFNMDRTNKFFADLTDEQLQAEVAPGRNRLIYLLGHLAAVHDGMLPLLGIGSRLYSEFDPTFLTTADRSVATLPSAAELKRASAEIDRALWAAFSSWSATDWLAKHTAISDEDFVREPHRNRFSVLLSRNTHIAFHYGQMVLARPRA